MSNDNNIIEGQFGDVDQEHTVQCVMAIGEGLNNAMALCDEDDGTYVHYLATRMAASQLIRNLGVAKYLEIVGQAIEMATTLREDD